MPVSAWLDLPRNLAIRLRGGAGGPWMVPSAVRRLDAMIMRDWRVLELGSGLSTPWFAERAGHVTSLEHDPDWHAETIARVKERNLSNAVVFLVDIDDMPARLKMVSDASVDLVVIDSDETESVDRMTCLAAVRRKVRPGGWIVLDDSDKPEYEMAAELLRGWSCERFVGVKPWPLTATETSAYRKPR